MIARRFLILVAALASIALANAAEPTTTQVFVSGDSVSVSFPTLNGKALNSLGTFNSRRVDDLRKHGYDNATLFNSGAVICITIPCADLFEANATVLSRHASSVLMPMVDVLEKDAPGRYKMLVVVHSDDTGDALYSHSLTGQRARAVAQFFKESQNRVTTFIPVGKGAENPVLNNSSRAERFKNRRVEILLVPTDPTLEAARQGKL